MFTGVIKEMGIVSTYNHRKDPPELEIDVSKESSMLSIGDSVAINGVCLTVVKHDDTRFQVEISRETLSRTNLGTLKRGDLVNIELPMTVSDRLDGHIVLGHVDGKVKLVKLYKEGGNTILTCSFPTELSKYIVDKGSVALDGISLTPFNKTGNTFSVTIIPHTLENTNLKIKHPGDEINIEVDILSKYIESILADNFDGKNSKLDKEFLNKHGYA